MTTTNHDGKTPFNDIAFAELYDKRGAGYGYHHALLNQLRHFLNETACNSIVDAGAGTGLLSIPLAQSGFIVHAVEPAYGMRAVLSGKIKDLRLPITIHPYTLETLPSLTADACIAIHSIYGMNPLERAIDEMMSIAPVVIIAVRTGRTYTISDFIRPYFNKQRSKHHSTKILHYLRDNSIPFTQQTIHHVHRVKMKDLYDEAFFQCLGMGLEKNHIPDIIAILEKSMNKNDCFWFDNIHNDEVFIIRR